MSADQQIGVDMEHIFLDTQPAHQKLGYGKLRIGDILAIESSDEDWVKIRAGISSHSKYYGKKFQTRTKDGVLYVKRIK